VSDQQAHERNLRVYDAKIRAAERAHDQVTEAAHRLFEAATRDAQSAIRIVLVINGGAAIAVLAFAGSLVSKVAYPVPQLTGIITNSLWFVFGAMTAAFAACFAYLTNLCYAGSLVNQTREWDFPFVRNTRASKWYLVAAWIFHILAILTAIAGIILFVIGMFAMRSALSLLH
jgi:hypothetical protein